MDNPERRFLSMAFVVGQLAGKREREYEERQRDDPKARVVKLQIRVRIDDEKFGADRDVDQSALATYVSDPAELLQEEWRVLRMEVLRQLFRRFES